MHKVLCGFANKPTCLKFREANNARETHKALLCVSYREIRRESELNDSQ